MSLNLLFPLDTFYSKAGMPLPPIAEISGAEMPEPYRQLLVGRHDMTPTLEAYHDDAIDLTVVARHLDGDALTRLVVLTLRDSGRPVEFGAIVINLQYFPEAARDDIVHGRFPLGSVLARHNIRHASCPQAFVRTLSDDRMNSALQLTGSCVLYGRRNYLLTPHEEILADILELLPP
jgi:chorismate-pyruvate lyase